MQPIDWILTIVPVLFVLGCAIYTHRYTKSVADFMAGGCAAGRYIICNAKGEAATGVANTLSKFQPLLIAGFTLSWWDALSVPILMLVAIFGFCVYRYRQTRAMTIGQFFEMRYSRKFRLFAGILGFLSGILNYGIFPAVSSQFFVYFLNLPLVTTIGPFHVPTRVVIMGSYLFFTLLMILVGGQITLLVTDCIEGVLSQFVWVVVVIAIFCTISWHEMRTALLAAPVGHSLVDPFAQAQTKDFNQYYAFIVLAMMIYNLLAVQKDNGFSAAARTPHEARMGNVLGNWRTFARSVMLVVLAVGAITFLKRADFPGAHALNSISDGQLRNQMTVPVALRFLLPAGVKGLFCTIMVLGLMSGDASHILTWGGVFIQDVVLPIRGKPMSARQHVAVLRFAVIGVALFAFIFSIFFHQIQYIAMWWAVTEGIFACGAGAAIIGGLYWSRGTTTAAWVAFILGSTLSVFGIYLPYVTHFPFNGRQVQFFAAVIASVAYIVTSYLTYDQPFDMDRLLHRGKYAIADDITKQARAAGPAQGGLSLSRLLGFDEDFTFWDKIVSGGIFFWSMFWLVVCLVGTIWNLIKPWPSSVWTSYWLVVGVAIPLGVAIVTLVWFGIGGANDLRLFFARLSSMKRDSNDDGTVGEHTPFAKITPRDASLTPATPAVDDYQPDNTF